MKTLVLAIGLWLAFGLYASGGFLGLCVEETWYVAVDVHWDDYLYDVRFADDQVKKVKLLRAPALDRGTCWQLTLHKHWAAGQGVNTYVVDSARQLVPSGDNRLEPSYWGGLRAMMGGTT